MNNIDTNIDNYTINELFSILNNPSSNEEMIYTTNKYINKYTNENNNQNNAVFETVSRLKIIQEIKPVETELPLTNSIEDIVSQISQLSKEDLIQLLITKLSYKELSRLL
jgi:hypothetical protein